MHVGRRFRLTQTLAWSWKQLVFPTAWAGVVVVAYESLAMTWISLPWLPISTIATLVSFYLGFKNNQSYDRMWEARKIWGAIVNASRSWTFSSRDLVTDARRVELGLEPVGEEEIERIRTTLVHRHVAWMDAFRHQLRKVKSWEHDGASHARFRKAMIAEFGEDMGDVLTATLMPGERDYVLTKINPAAHLLAAQSKQLAELRARHLLDPYAHVCLQELLHELMTQQGKAERIKNFPLPRQYATVNSFFAYLFVLLLPAGMAPAFAAHGAAGFVWVAVPLS
ncbi:MAG: bestrophin family ion channel, partial [Myxococcota bacterium]